MHVTPGSAESGRLAAVRRYDTVEYADDGALADIAGLAAQVIGAPIAMVSLVGSDRIRCVACRGIDALTAERSPGLCTAAIESDTPLVVVDATLDPLARDHPLVVGDPRVRSYVGVPLVAGGHRIGTLCVLDPEPRAFEQHHVATLEVLARLVVDELELRVRSSRLDEAEAELDRSLTTTRRERERFTELVGAMPAMVWSARPDGAVDWASQTLYDYVGRTEGEVDLLGGDWEDVVHPDDAGTGHRAWSASVATGHDYWTELRLRRHDGEFRWHLMTGRASLDDDQQVASWFGTAIDIHDLRVAEDALRARERRLSAILEGEPECVTVVSADGALVEMNPAGLTMIAAADLAAVRGHPVSSLVHPDDVEMFMRLHAEASAGSDGRAEFRVVALDGSVRWVESHSVPLEAEADGRSAVLTVTRDVTQRRELDDELRETAALLRLASRLGRLGGWSTEAPFTVVHWSDEVAMIHDMPAGHQVNIDEGLEFYAPEYRETISASFAECVDDGTSFDIEAEVITGTGRRIWSRTIGEAERDESGRVVRVAGAVQDISDHRSAIEALRTSEELFRLLSEATSDVVFDWDLTTDQIWYGDGLDVLIGDGVAGVFELAAVKRRIHPDDVDRWESSVRAVAAGTDDLWTEEVRLVHADGREITVECNGYVIRDADGSARRLVGSLVEMTAQRALEERLAQSQRLEAVGQLTGGIAHDFNNLLTVILGNADLLVEELGDDGDLGESASMMRAAAERGADLTQRLLAFARRQPLEPTVVDVASLLGRLDGLLRRTLGEDIEIEQHHADGTWNGLVDGAQLESAVLNICLNARDAMPDGGHLHIEATNVTIDDDQYGGPAGHGDGLRAGDYVVIAISDTGVGMTPEIAARAFDPFFTTKGAGEGSGLGLSMVYGFAKQSGGHVGIHSEEGEGTVVRLFIPRAPVDMTAQTTRPAPARRARGDERILLVEDDEMVRGLAAAQLRGLGYEVVDAVDGPSALAALAAPDPDGRARRFGLLFTDVIMPGGMNGRELAEAVRAVQPHIPVLFTSGYTEDAIVHNGRIDPGVDLLSKPYRLDELAQRVRAAIDRTTAAHP